MLTYLKVRNLGLIEDATIEPTEGFTVITGETGTGKTLLLGALRLLIGEKPNSTSVGPFGDTTQVEGVFEREGVEIGISRVVPGSGRSRAFVEGKVVSASVLAEEVGSLVLIAGQHEHVRLGTATQLLGLIDADVDRRDPAVRAEYQKAWDELAQLRTESAEIGGDTGGLIRELEFLRHQLTEIDSAEIADLDDEGADALASRLRNLDSIRSELAEALTAIDGLTHQAGLLVSAMRRLSELDPSVADEAATAESVAEQSNEMRRTLTKVQEGVDLSETERLEMEDLVNRIGDLKRRYGRTIADVLQFRASAAERAEEITGLTERARTLDSEIAEMKETLEKKATALTRARTEAASHISKSVMAHLGDLGLESAHVTLELEGVEPMRTGADRATLRFSSDQRLEPGPMTDVASGGELSRLVLALRLAAGPDTATTLVFDEADAGIGGRTALVLGEKLAALAKGSQVVAVTHLPQVAARADAHYVVDRNESAATVRLVDGDERIMELSRMLAGLPDSRGGQEAASELLAAARG